MAKKIIHNILLCLPLIYSVYVFYIGVLISGVPRDITIIDSNYKLFILGLITSGFAIRIYLALKALNIIPVTQPKFIVLIYLKAMVYFINQHLTTIKANVIRELILRFTYFNNLALKLIQNCHQYVRMNRFGIILFFLEIGTKIIVLFTLLIEVFYFKQINYFYKILVLLLVPVILKFITDTMGVFYNDNINTIIGLLDSEPIYGTEYHEFCFYDVNLVPNSFFNLNDFVENLLCPVFEYVYTLGNIHESRISYKFPQVLLFIDVCYLITWGFVLVVGLGLLL